MLVQLLAAQAWVAESVVDVAAPVRAGEQDAVDSAVPGRVAEFVTGRWCARQALAAAGVPEVDLPAGRSGAPRWPVGTVGSITHCQGYRAAAVARSQRWAAIGVDAEPTQPLPDGVWETITSAGERRHVSALGRWCDLPLDRVVFSAKESIYKAWSARTSRWLDFTDAELRLALDGTFTARLHRFDVRCPRTITGRWAGAPPLLVTAVLIPASADRPSQPKGMSWPTSTPRTPTSTPQ